VAFLALALVTFFDFKYSPSVRMREQPVSFLTFYYMGALCVGYFSGYMLLVFGPIPAAGLGTAASAAPSLIACSGGCGLGGSPWRPGLAGLAKLPAHSRRQQPRSSNSPIKPWTLCRPKGDRPER
jgi:hypothetical protein